MKGRVKKGSERDVDEGMGFLVVVGSALFILWLVFASLSTLFIPPSFYDAHGLKPPVNLFSAFTETRELRPIKVPASALINASHSPPTCLCDLPQTST